MVYRGKLKNGVVVLDDVSGLPEGTEVAVRPVKVKVRDKLKGPKKPQKLRRSLMKFAGKAKGLPRDASRNVDHYLYGHPKR
jgi:hypothetical protein